MILNINFSEDYRKINMVIYTVYKIQCLDETVDGVYVGITKDMKKRKSSHEVRCNNCNCEGYDIKLYRYIRGNGGWGNFIMEKIVEKECENDLERKKLEREYILLYGTLNQCIPAIIECKGGSSAWYREWREENKEKAKEYSKEYYQKNQEKAKGYSKEYYQNNQEKAKIYQREWREANKEYQKEYHQEYREKNKDKLNEQKSQKIVCPCGSTVRRDVMVRHKRSLKHRAYQN